MEGPTLDLKSEIDKINRTEGPVDLDEEMPLTEAEETGRRSA
jgi:hypothetical protein